MTLADFFASNTVALPRGGFKEGKQTFDTFLSDAFRDYVALVQTVEDPEFPSLCARAKDSIREIKTLSEQIVSAVKHYLQGYPHQAYEEIEKSLRILGTEKLTTNLSGFASGSNQGYLFDNFLECTLHPPLYRMRSDRIAAATGSLSRKNIFHVPFEMRRLVRNQRYSIAGLPSLYLGSSIWISWDELGRPDLDSVFVSRFRIVEEVKVLDFQLPPQLAWRIFEWALGQSKAAVRSPSISIDELLARYSDGFIASYIACWPLLAACSIRVNSRDGSFFPQYIVPQLLLQWVTKAREVDGIRYFSTRTSEKAVDFFINVNCVLPARVIANEGHCSYLKRKFNLTAPIPWEILQLLDLQNRFVPGPANSQGAVKVSDDFVAAYVNTGFFRAETSLGVMEAEPGKSAPVED
jgi:hypothetical protein